MTSDTSKAAPSGTVAKPDSNASVTTKPKELKRNRPDSSEKASGLNSRKMPKRAAASSAIAEDEIAGISMTSGPNDPRPNRRLADFTFHIANGKPHPVEVLEVDDLFISGTILPLEESSGKGKEKGVRCEGFGRIESWTISGYEEGRPVIWVSTNIADYDCVQPANGYKRLYSLFFEKANACVQVYQTLSNTSGGDPNLTLNELLARVFRSMSTSKTLPLEFPIREFIVSQGEFIYNQLIGLDGAPEKNERTFRDMPVLTALKDESKKQGYSVPPKEDGNMKLASLMLEEENWQSQQRKSRRRAGASSSNFSFKINEDEIANDYPLPAYYNTCIQETDEYIIFGFDVDGCDSSELPQAMLHNWSLYNSDSRLISLELLPMNPCANIDVTIFGSGIMRDDDGSGYFLDDDIQSSSSSGGVDTVDGRPIYLSAIKEWKIEFGSSMVSISIRTDMAWYRLGKPSKQYRPWYEPVLRTARLAISIIAMLKEQSRVSRLSFADVIKRVSEYDKDHPAYISSHPTMVESYVIVHGQIILQQFSEYPDNAIKKNAFATGLYDKMEQRHQNKWLVKKKVVLKKEVNMNPRAAIAPLVSKRKAMLATTTRLINRIWGEYYLNSLPEDSKESSNCEIKEAAEEEEDVDHEEYGEEDSEDFEEKKMDSPHSMLKMKESGSSSNNDVRWDGEAMGQTPSGEAIYQRAIVCGESVNVGGFVLVDKEGFNEFSHICLVEYMYENSKGEKIIHARLMMRGYHTVLGNTADDRELFLTNDCQEFEVNDFVENLVVKTRMRSWGYQHRKANAEKDKADKESAEDRKHKGLSLEYFCRSLYWPERGAFFSLPVESMGLGNGVCHSCKLKEAQREKETFKVNLSMTGFTQNGIEYNVHDFVYLAPNQFAANGRDNETFKGGRNVGLKAYVVCQLLEIEVPNAPQRPFPESTMVKVRRFYRPEDISTRKAYSSDIREVYYSEDVVKLPAIAIQGKCEVRKKKDLPALDSTAILDHIFFCEHVYDPVNEAVKQLPGHIELSSMKERVVDDSAHRKRKGKYKEEENDFDDKNRLATLDIFAGCGGLSEGLQQAGVSLTKWAIEYEETAGEAFNLNHPEALMFINNCNVILRAIMSACGDGDDCISTSEAGKLVEKLDEKVINSLPRPGQVEFINGGPPCEGFSGMNRFNQSTWSKVQCEMILAFLSFADYFRPKYFLLENVKNFVTFNKGQTFRLTLASLLEMGYQVRFGILEAGAYSVSQSRKRAFIWAASPEETLPEWPEPMHVFAGPELKVSLSKSTHYAAVRSTANGAPFRAITVRDTIGDLPAVINGASTTTMEYKSEPVSWFQHKIRGDTQVLTDHISKEMNELNLIRCKRIPKRPGADWRNLPNEKFELSTGQMADLIPWCLPNTAKRHNQWKGLFGRLDWEGNFPTSVTDPQPMGKVGMCFHLDQDRIITVRECARSQGFPDSYKFAGNIQHKHRQIGNAVPPPLAFSLGRKLKEAVEGKCLK